MTLSAALDSGLAFGLLAVFFVFVFPGITKGFHWWGTEVYKQVRRFSSCPFGGTYTSDNNAGLRLARLSAEDGTRRRALWPLILDEPSCILTRLGHPS